MNEKYGKLVKEIFSSTKCPFNVLSYREMDIVKPFLFKQDTMNENDIDTLIEKAKGNEFIRFFLIKKVKNLSENQLDKLIQISSNYEQLMLFTRSNITESQINTIVKNTNKNDLCLFFKANAGKYSDKVIKYFIKNKEILGNEKFLPYKYLDDTELNRLFLSNLLEKDSFNEELMTNIANNEKLHSSIRNEAFNNGCYIEKIKNPTKHMANQIYLSVIDIIFDEKIEKNSYIFHNAQKILLEIYKNLEDEYILDFIERMKSIEDKIPIQRKVCNELVKKTKSEIIEKSFLELNDERITFVIKSKLGISDTAYEYLKDKVKEDEKKKIFANLMMFNYTKREWYQEFIDANDKDMMKLMIASTYTPIDIQVKIERWANKNSENEIKFLLEFKKKLNKISFEKGQYSYFFTKFILSTMKNTNENIEFRKILKSIVKQSNELDVKSVLRLENKEFIDVINEMKESPYENTELSVLLDDIQNYYNNILSTYHYFLYENGGTSCFNINGDIVNVDVNKISECNEYEYGRFMDTINKSSIEALKLMRREIVYELQWIKNKNEFNYTVLKTCEFWDSICNKISEIERKEILECSENTKIKKEIGIQQPATYETFESR